MKTFNLEIELGNDGMQTGHDLSKALQHIAQYVNHYFFTDEIQRVTEVKQINDNNGNNVGSWRILTN